ncbi:unnamed protein product [Phytophthora fragariaefolia]|uniref:Unnamed protein product n=1 Tax=Phytophthora fragariaefolia TaxID=1490495 RepID=A0A9W7D922_9STRA|nr:unnamed protein product [Phytophthora fragariaefolia]
MVAKGTRAAKGLTSLWTTDRSTFPVVLLVGFAMTAALGNCVRHLMSNPDVCVTKPKRDNSLRYSDEQGIEWLSKRRSLATIQENVINKTFENEPAKK